MAESCATLGELRRELRGETPVAHTSLEDWLCPPDGRSQPEFEHPRHNGSGTHGGTVESPK
jgi:hypothetical protein